MNEEQIKEVVNELVSLVKRISERESRSPAEIMALPEIVKELREPPLSARPTDFHYRLS